MPARRRSRQRPQLAVFVQSILDSAPIYLDTETTGMDKHAEIVELAILDSDGTTLIDTLLQPTTPIPFAAQQVHGIDNDDVRHAPRLTDIWPAVDELLQTRPVVIYNSAFDLRLLAQSANKQQIFPRQPAEVYCAMLIYAEFYGQWNSYHESYVWQRLGEAVTQCAIELPDGLRLHRAAADSVATRLIMQAMAAYRK